MVQFDKDQSREIDIDMEAAIEAAIAASLQDGPDRGGLRLVEHQVGDFVQPPLCPFERMDEQSRQRLHEAEAVMARGEELPAGPQYGQVSPEGWRVEGEQAVSKRHTTQEVEAVGSHGALC